MTIDLAAWRDSLANQRKTYVHGRVKEGENWMQDCFRKVFNKNKFPLVFTTNPNLYKLPS